MILYNLNYTFEHCKLKNKIMKKLILLSAIALLGFTSCKKNEVEAPKDIKSVSYYAWGEGLSITYTDNEGVKTENVTQEFKYKFEVNGLDSAKIAFKLPATSKTQLILVRVMENNKVIQEYRRNYIQGGTGVDEEIKIRL